jgi:hypothetical protein
VPDLAAQPLGARPVSDLLDRKPHLLRPFAKQLLPRPAPIDPAERRGIDLKSVRTAEDCRQVRATALASIARGEIAPAEGARIAQRVRDRVDAPVKPAHDDLWLVANPLQFPGQRCSKAGIRDWQNRSSWPDLRFRGGDVTDP